jgi:hypothetical protein
MNVGRRHREAKDRVDCGCTTTDRVMGSVHEMSEASLPLAWLSALIQLAVQALEAAVACLLFAV